MRKIKWWLQYARSSWGTFWKYVDLLKKGSFNPELTHTSAVKPRVMVMNFASAIDCWSALLFVVAYQLKGYEVVVLTDNGGWPEWIYRRMNVRVFISFRKYFSEAEHVFDLKSFKGLVASATTFESLLHLEYMGVRVGKYVCSSLVRRTYSGNVDLQDPAVNEKMIALLRQSILTVNAAKKIFDATQPKSLIFLEKGYTPYGEFFDLALRKNLDVIQWCGSHNQNFFTLKRYTWDTSTVHPSSLSTESWELLKALPWDTDKAEQVRKEVFQNYALGLWYGEVGTQFNKKMYEKADILSRLALDPTKKTAVIFPHLFWDATFFYGVDIFANYREWFVETVKAAVKNDRLNWIIKLHPANVVKLERDGYKGELVELTAIREQVGPLPSHIKILHPDSPINTYSLFEIMDYCLTVRGTIGIEAALFGKTVLTAGTGRYDNYGFTVDSTTKSDYLQKLARLETVPLPTKGETVLAEKFAFGTFILRPFPVKSLQLIYRNDKTASLDIQLKFDHFDELQKAEDIESFGAWAVDSRDKDFLRRDCLAQLSRPVAVLSRA